MRVQSYAEMLLGSGTSQPGRAMVSTAQPDTRSRGKRIAERQKRPAERDRRRTEPRAGGAEAPSVADPSPDPGLALASTLAHLALTAVRDAQGSRSAVLEAYADTD